MPYDYKRGSGSGREDEERARNVLAVKSRPDATPQRSYQAPRQVDHERVTSPDKPETGSPDWLLGRVIVDVEFIKREIKADGEQTRTLIDGIVSEQAAMKGAQARIEEKLDGVLALIPTAREKKFALWLATIIVGAVLTKFGIDTKGFTQGAP